MSRCLAMVLLVLSLAVSCAPREVDGPFAGASPERAAQLNAELGANYLQAGDLQQAKDRLERALEQDPDNVDAHITYAVLQSRLDDPDLARTHFRRATRLDPDNPRLQNNHGVFLCGLGEHDRAIELFVSAAENRLYRRPASAWTNAGTCAIEAGRTDEARRYLQQAVDIEPRAGAAWLALAEVEYDAGNTRSAERALNAFHDLAEPTARSLWLAVRIERARNDRAAADAHGRQLLRHFPDSTEAERFLETR